MTRIWRRIGIVAFWLSWPALYLKLRSTVRVRIVVLYEGKVLLVRNWYNSGQWQLPGGGVRRGESWAATAQRELAEEVNIELKQQAFSSLGPEFSVKERGLPFRCQPVIAHALSDEFSIKKCEIATAKWQPVAQVAKKLSHSSVVSLALVEKHH